MKKEFTLTDEEFRKVQKWIKKHNCTMKNTPSCMEAKITYNFTPTKNGVGVIVGCLCGQILKVREF